MQYIFHEIVKSQFHISVLCCPISYIFAKIGQIGPISHAATTRRDMTFYRICSIKHRDICMTVYIKVVRKQFFHFPLQLNFMKGLLVCSKKITTTC